MVWPGISLTDQQLIGTICLCAPSDSVFTLESQVAGDREHTDQLPQGLLFSQRSELVCAVSGVGFKSHLSPVRWIYIIMLYLFMDFSHALYMKITSRAVSFLPQKGSLIWWFGNFLVFVLATNHLLDILQKMFDPTWWPKMILSTN